jgi:hypothetical protein
MNKLLAITASVAGVISAGLLMMGMSSFDSVASFTGCSHRSNQASGATVTRDLQWQGGDAIDIKVPAAVHFSVAPTWRAVATGSSEALARLHMHDGEIEFDPSFSYCGDDVQIELQGPAVSHWSISGSGELVLQGLHQDQLDTIWRVLRHHESAAMCTRRVPR